jgi:hypothetical protein
MMSAQALPVTKVLFDLRLMPDQIPLFKTEILHLQDPGKDIWHNHLASREDHDFERGVRIKKGRVMGSNYQRYPLIQFRTELVNKRYHACLWGIGEGSSEIKSFLDRKKEILIGKGREQLQLRVIDLQDNLCYPPLVWTDIRFKKYSLTHFLPFNEDRYREFRSKIFFADKLELIERMVAHNLNLFVQDFFPDTAQLDRLTVRALDLKGFKTAKYRPKKSLETLNYVSVDMHIGINADFASELSIGNLKSLGYGILRHLKE